MTTIIAFIIILSLLIFVHELGHFIVAKRSGIVVEEFAIGFPPRVWKFWQDEGKITLDGQEYVLGRKLTVPRSIELGAEIFAETGVDTQGRAMVTYLEPIEQPATETEASSQKNSEARLFDKFDFKARKSDSSESAADRRTFHVDALARPTEYSINLIPLGGYVRMLGEEDPTDPGSFASKNKRTRFAVLAAGSFMNLLLAVVFFTFTSMSGVPEPVTGTNLAGEETPIASTLISEVVPDTPASEAGIEAGDVVVGADDLEFKYVGDLVFYVNENKGNEITLHLQGVFYFLIGILQTR